MLTPAFHFTILDQFMEVFNEQSRVLVTKLRETGDQRVNVFPFITKATLDIICGKGEYLRDPVDCYRSGVLVYPRTRRRGKGVGEWPTILFFQ